MHRWTLGLVLVCLASAGCVVPPISPASVPLDAPSHAGYGTSNWSLVVTDEDGNPVPGAAVIVSWPGQAPGDSPEERSQAVVLARQEPIPFVPRATVTPHYVQLRADDAGQVTWQSPSRYPVSVSATGTGLTEEWLRLGTHQVQPLEIRLYPRSVKVSWTTTWDVDTNLACDLRVVDFGAHYEEYSSRLTAAQVYLNWTNGAAGGIADWELAYDVFESLDFAYVPNCQAQRGAAGAHLSLGAQHETLHLDQHVINMDSTSIIPNWFLMVGPSYRSLGPAGVPPNNYLMEYSIDFVGDLGLADIMRAQNMTEYRGSMAVPAPADGGDDPAGLYGDPTFDPEGRRNSPGSALVAGVAILLLCGAARRRGIRD